VWRNGSFAAQFRVLNDSNDASFNHAFADDQRFDTGD
jgi:hypothetical protein